MAPLASRATSSTATRILSSDHVLQLDHVPARVAVIGGGAIGCEFASFLADVGSTVTVLEALPQVLTGVDQQVAQTAVRAFTKRGHEGAHRCDRSAPPEIGEKSVTVPFTGKNGEERLEVDVVVVSVGRSPRSVGRRIRASRASRSTSAASSTVDGQMRTSVADVYAVGDLVAHTAARARRVRRGDRRDQDDARGEPAAGRLRQGAVGHLLPSRGRVLRPDRGAGAARPAATSSPRCTASAATAARSIIGEPDGLVKIVAERDGPLLGVHIVGPWATELIAEGYLSVNWEATAADLGLLIHAHPTLSELFGESALALTGRSLHG